MNNFTETKLKIEIELLESLPHTHAFTGDLEDIKCKSYVDYSLVLKLLNNKRIELKNSKRFMKRYCYIKRKKVNKIY